MNRHYKFQKCAKLNKTIVLRVSVADTGPFETDPDPACHIDTDSDSAFQFDTDQDPAG
jgi:hypothetical protein